MKPTQLKAIAGTARPDRMRQATIQRLTTVPEPPESLSSGARAEWIALAPAALAVGLTAADLRAFALLCECLATAGELAAVVRVAGCTLQSGESVKAHPALAALASARKDAAGMLGRFGLDPRGRVSLPTSPAPSATANPFAALGTSPRAATG